MSAGGFHTCALASDGTLACWGDNGAGQAPTLTPASLPPGVVSTAYGPVTLEMTAARYTPVAPAFDLIGTLPDGLVFDAASATLWGTPTQGGSFPLSVRAMDANGFVASRDYTLEVIADTMPPVITPMVPGTLGENGWYRSEVSVSWSVVVSDSHGARSCRRPRFPRSSKVRHHHAREALHAAKRPLMWHIAEVQQCAQISEAGIDLRLFWPVPHCLRMVFEPDTAHEAGNDRFEGVRNPTACGSVSARSETAVRTVPRKEPRVPVTTDEEDGFSAPW